MTTIVLGVDDVPYSFTENVGTTKNGKNKGKNKGRKYASTTGDVAEILEEQYHIMEVFFTRHHEEIIALLEESAQGGFETLMMGGVSDDAFAAAGPEIEKLFQVFIDSKEMDGIALGGSYPVPTHASIIGINSRKKQLDPGRPSFKDTGLYEASFRAWVDARG